ncbi:MAG: YigZ family protein [Ginsengibacter sp.]
MDFYNTIETAGSAEFKERGSKFLAFAYPIQNENSFKRILQALKKEHPKAAHHCFAYRLGFDGNNFRMGDDGEPAGTAGKPLLGQIDSKNLTNILVLVVRYFGGTLLGIPGLTAAYKTSASLVLQCTPAIQKSIEIDYTIEFDYNLMNEVMQILKQNKCTIIENETQLFCKIKAGIPKKKLAQVLNAFQDLQKIEFEPANKTNG